MARSNMPNRHIQCNVRSCKNHCSGDNYCSLDTICIGGTASSTACAASTDCQSYSCAGGFSDPSTSENCAEDMRFRF